MCSAECYPVSISLSELSHCRVSTVSGNPGHIVEVHWSSWNFFRLME